MSGGNPSRSGSGGNSQAELYRLLGYGLQIGSTIFLMYYVMPYMIDMLSERLDGGKQEKKNPSIAEKLKRDDLKNLVFTKHESIIANDIVPRGSCEATFADVGGLEKEIRQIREGIVVPMRLWRVFNGKRRPLRYPSGMLLYGKPGTGKTMCVQALANEVDASLISIKASTLLDKYIGESPKLVTGLFSLARKIAPTVVFIDEIDTLMRTRGIGGADGGSALAMDGMQGAFLSEWDGLQGTTADGGPVPPVIVVGATNRPNSLDKAILRRMPISIQMPMPTAEAREEILRKQTGDEEVAADMQWGAAVEATEGMSGSDIRELVRVAVLRRDQELVDAVMAVEGEADAEALEALANRPVRPLNSDDFAFAASRAKPTVDEATEFQSSVVADEIAERMRIAERTKDKLKSSQLPDPSCSTIDSSGPELD